MYEPPERSGVTAFFLIRIAARIWLNRERPRKTSVTTWLNGPVRAVPGRSSRHLRGGRSLHAEEAAPEVAGPILTQYVCTVPVTRPYFDATFTDPVGTFTREARRHPVFRLGSGPTG
jgi:hypothetical protein